MNGSYFICLLDAGAIVYVYFALAHIVTYCVGDCSGCVTYGVIHEKRMGYGDSADCISYIVMCNNLIREFKRRDSRFYAE